MIKHDDKMTAAYRAILGRVVAREIAAGNVPLDLFRVRFLANADFIGLAFKSTAKQADECQRIDDGLPTAETSAQIKEAFGEIEKHLRPGMKLVVM